MFLLLIQQTKLKYNSPQIIMFLETARFRIRRKLIPNT